MASCVFSDSLIFLLGVGVASLAVRDRSLKGVEVAGVSYGLNADTSWRSRRGVEGPL